MTESNFDPRYRYPNEKLAAARRILMLPHAKGETESLTGAFWECEIGLKEVRDDMLDDNSRGWVRTIRETMDTSHVDKSKTTPTRGTAYVRADELDIEEKQAFSNAVGELADWFHRKMYHE